MPKRVTITCPKHPDRRYFSEKIHRYSNRLNIYYNDRMLFPGINDAEEYLPQTFESVLEYDENAINRFRFEYNIKIDTAEEYADVIFQLLPEGACNTFIIRKNYVEGSELLDTNYRVDFTINGETKTLDKDYHKGKTHQIKFESKYVYPLDIRWESRKSFMGSDKITYDEIEFRIDDEV
jgi:hypothetical protein